MECLICFKYSDYTSTTDIPRDFKISQSVCKLLNISDHLALDTFSRIFNSDDDICSDCYERFVKVEELFKELDGIQLKLALAKNHIVGDVLKSQQISLEKGCQSEERTKLVQELLKTEPSIKNDNKFLEFQYEQGQVDDFVGDVEFNDVESTADDLDNITTCSFSDRQDQEQAEHKTEMLIIKDLWVVLENMDLPSQTQSFNINEEPVKSILTSQNRKPSNVILNKTIRKSSKGIKQIHRKNFDKFCKICNRKFKTYKKFMADQDRHRGTVSRPFKCDFCNLAFPRKDILINHLAIHGQGPQARQCHFCGKWMARYQLNLHIMRTHTENAQSYVCDFKNCTQSYKTPTSLSDHRKNQHLEMKFDCMACNKVFNTAEDLQEHVLKIHKHKGIVSKPFKCTHCDLAFLRNDILINHLAIHGVGPQARQCHICQKWMARYQLNHHITRTHAENAQSYICDVENCTKSFKFPQGLDEHRLRQHPGMKFEYKACNKVLNTAEGLQEEHVHKIHEHKKIVSKPFKCDHEHCNLSFSRNDILINHLAIHGVGPQARQCHICQKWMTRYQLNHHITSVHAENAQSYVCDVENCTKSFKYPQGLDDHQKRHHLGMKFECTSCDKVLNTSVGLKEHVRKIHKKNKNNDEDEDQDKDKEIISKCEHCDLPFSRKYDLINHLATHGVGSEARQCHICGKYMGRRGQLKYHIMRVHAENQYVCDFENCTRSFKFPKSLREHRLSQHLGMKFECKSCDKVLNTADGLREHVLKIHEKKVRVFCTYKDCRKGFMNNSTLRRHISQSHLKIRNYVCEKCPVEKRFVTPRLLRVHNLKFHTLASEYEFRCRFCPKAFTLQKYLNNHEELHLGIKNFICHICSEGYTNNSGLIRHLRNFHDSEGSINRKIKYVRRVKVPIVQLIEQPKEGLLL